MQLGNAALHDGVIGLGGAEALAGPGAGMGDPRREGADLLQQRPDKEWSLCDAVSFLLMPAHGVQDALTTDHHFEQAGFVRL